MGIPDTAGPYTLQQQVDEKGYNLVLALEEQPETEAQRQWLDEYLSIHGWLFLPLAGDAAYLSWYYPDGTGSQLEWSSSYDRLAADPETYAYLYAHRSLWWWEALSFQGLFIYSNELDPLLYHPAYSAAEVIYTNTTPSEHYMGLDGLDLARSSIVIHPDCFAVGLGNGTSALTQPEYVPLDDDTLSDPRYHPENLLEGQAVQAAYSVVRSDFEQEGPYEHLWDSGDRIYQTENGVYLANWYLDFEDPTQSYLAYVFRLEEKPVSGDLAWLEEHP